jgi:hypothetical protein
MSKISLWALLNVVSRYKARLKNLPEMETICTQDGGNFSNANSFYPSTSVSSVQFSDILSPVRGQLFKVWGILREKIEKMNFFPRKWYHLNIISIRGNHSLSLKPFTIMYLHSSNVPLNPWCMALIFPQFRLYVHLMGLHHLVMPELYCLEINQNIQRIA